MSFNTTTGVLDWTPNYTDEGTYEIKITADDGNGGSSADLRRFITNTISRR